MGFGFEQVFNSRKLRANAMIGYFKVKQLHGVFLHVVLMNKVLISSDKVIFVLYSF